jgi:5-methyltetrahydropteroyltriglutamate--homocysteine methyltransferase
MLTTVIGSHPVEPGLTVPDAIKMVVEDQLGAGIDLVSDGQTRYDMIEYFARAIDGYSVDGGKSVVTGQIGAGRPDEFVQDFRVAKSLAPRVKGLVTGPVTMVFSTRLKAPYSGYKDENVYLDTARALLDIARALVAEGAEWIQIDEPFLSVGAPMNLARKAVEAIATNLSVPVALHVCGSVGTIFPELQQWDGITLLSHAFMGDKNDDVLESAGLSAGKKMLGLGCIDTKVPAVDSVDNVLSLIRRGMSVLPAERIAIHPDCGMRLLPREAAVEKLKVMVTAARQAGNA